jgi:hypothetical protein
MKRNRKDKKQAWGDKFEEEFERNFGALTASKILESYTLNFTCLKSRPSVMNTILVC